MEKSTLSALILAGGGALAAAIQVFALRAAKRKRETAYEAATREKEAELDEITRDD